MGAFVLPAHGNHHQTSNQQPMTAADTSSHSKLLENVRTWPATECADATIAIWPLMPSGFLRANKDEVQTHQETSRLSSTPTLLHTTYVGGSNPLHVHV